MKYFATILIFLLFSSSIILGLRFIAKVRLDHYSKLINRAIAKRQEKLNNNSFFSSRLIHNLLKNLLKKKKNRSILLNLQAGRLNKAIVYLQKRKETIPSLELSAYLYPKVALKKLEIFIKNEPQNVACLLLMSQLYLSLNNEKKARLCLDSLEGKKLSKTQQAQNSFLQSYFQMQEGDLSSASKNCSQAIGYFKKYGYLFEEAQAYWRLGTIYRISSVGDIAQMMLETAFKIFNELQFRDKCAEVWGNLGMLMVMENRQEEAQDYFEKALDLFTKIKQEKGQADVLNQMALAAIIADNLQSAFDYAEKALALHSNSNNEQGEAFSLELLGHIYSLQKKWNKVISCTQKAIVLYQKNHNIAALLEAEFLEANALFESQEEEAAEKRLRQIIEKAKSNQTCFHVANAYNLLGLIYLAKNELQHAKGLFQQSVDCEQQSNRLDGLAISYANLSLIELKRGKKEQAQKTLQVALEYAMAHGETELSKMLEEKLSKNLTAFAQ